MDASGGMEWETIGATTAPTITTTHPHSGSYECRFNVTAGNAGFTKKMYNGGQARIFYGRIYLYVASMPTANVDIIVFQSGAGGYACKLKANGTIGLYTQDGFQKGGDSVTVLSTGTWYRVELMADPINDLAELRLDGAVVATHTAGAGAVPDNDTFTIGLAQGTTTADIYMDDVALNDDTGSFENTWPGPATGVIHLRPNAAGSNTQFTIGGSAPAATNWEGVDEVTPDAGVTINTETTSNEIDDYNCDATPAGLASGDTVKCVAVGERWRNALGIGATNHVIRCTYSGTTEESGTIAVGSGYITFKHLLPRIHQLVMYDEPGASTTAWTKTSLDAMEIGARAVTGAGVSYDLTAIWGLVEWEAAAAARQPRPGVVMGSMAAGHY